MVIPDTFGVRGERTIASYNFINIVEGTGIITYYMGTGLDDNAANFYTMQSSLFYSQEIEITIATGVLPTADYELKVEKNYNMTVLNLPLTAKGIAMINISWAFKTTAAANGYGYLIVKLIKVSEGSETIIGTGKTDTITASGTYGKKDTTLLLDLTKTHLKKGDNFRLSIEGWAKNMIAAQTGTFAWGQDPKNRDGTIFTPSTNDSITALQINIPLEINL